MVLPIGSLIMVSMRGGEGAGRVAMEVWLNGGAKTIIAILLNAHILLNPVSYM